MIPPLPSHLLGSSLGPGLGSGALVLDKEKLCLAVGGSPALLPPPHSPLLTLPTSLPAPLVLASSHLGSLLLPLPEPYSLTPSRRCSLSIFSVSRHFSVKLSTLNRSQYLPWSQCACQYWNTSGCQGAPCSTAQTLLGARPPSGTCQLNTL